MFKLDRSPSQILLPATYLATLFNTTLLISNHSHLYWAVLLNLPVNIDHSIRREVSPKLQWILGALCCHIIPLNHSAISSSSCSWSWSMLSLLLLADGMWTAIDCSATQ